MAEEEELTVESTLLRLLISAGFLVRMGMKYGACGSAMAPDMTAKNQDDER
jgi:hypothetical protein